MKAEYIHPHHPTISSASTTIVIYMSDHSKMPGDLGIFCKEACFYEGAIRVPMIIRWPGKYKTDATGAAPEPCWRTRASAGQRNEQ
jgi:glucan phosphoethanolaminetransferase (alkaline phosphatase superfamily)